MPCPCPARPLPRPLPLCGLPGLLRGLSCPSSTSCCVASPSARPGVVASTEPESMLLPVAASAALRPRPARRHKEGRGRTLRPGLHTASTFAPSSWQAAAAKPRAAALQHERNEHESKQGAAPPSPPPVPPSRTLHGYSLIKQAVAHLLAVAAIRRHLPAGVPPPPPLPLAALLCRSPLGASTASPDEHLTR